MKRTSAITLLILVTILLIPGYVLAQVPPPTPAPIDGLSEVLLISGAAYVARKMWKNRKNQTEEEEL